MTAVLDSPMFGYFGTTIADMLNGTYKNPVNNMIPGFAGTVTKGVLNFQYLSPFNFKLGRFLNNEITTINAFNPIHTMPGLGILFDRFITDGLRDLVYDDVKKYYGGMNNYAHQQGFRYAGLAKPNSFYGDS